MESVRSFVAAAIVAVAVPGVAAAQSADQPLTPLQTVVACAPPPSLDIPSDPLRIVGSQDSVSRTAFDEKDVLVVGGGAKNGLQIGQRYFIRRPIVFGAYRSRPSGALTLGWLRIVAVNESNAIAAVEHFCDSIARGDYLEPFVAPTVPADADGQSAKGELDFTTLGRVLTGTDNRAAAGSGELMMIDQGTDQGMEAGARFAIYRDTRAPGVPLASIGEGVVLSAGKTMSLTRITRSRDAVVSGDYVVPRK